TLLRVLAGNGGVAASRIPQVAAAVAATLARWPFTLAERGLVAARRHRVANDPPPLFILGHWRSGTTHLYNVMSRSEAFAYVSPYATALPWDFLLLGRLLQPLLAKALPKHRYIDNIPVESDSPQEDEIALANMTPLSFYHGLYFPRRLVENFNTGVFFDGCNDKAIAAWQRLLRYYYDKLRLAQPGRRLLIKNPVYTARAGLLKAMWPDAKFIHIHRNPYIVFASMRNFYRKLLAQFALQPYDGIDVDALIFSAYARMMAQLDADRASLGDSQFVELGFDAFQADPLGQLEQIYRRLDLPGFAAARPAFAAYLETVKDYRKNRYGFDPDLIGAVRAHWAPYIDRWGYRPPD
ncbi:MAG: sulfotransferase, partial [Alphaproteobacteria bacterium]